MLRKLTATAIVSTLAITLTACQVDESMEESNSQESNVEENTTDNQSTTDEESSLEETEVDYSGTYVGYSWKDEDEGVTLDDASQKVETTITLDADGTITDVDMLFLKKDKEGNWYSRTETDADVMVDFSVEPTKAILETEEMEYSHGDSLFDIKTADMMAFYSVSVDENGTVAFGVVEPYSRYLFEYKLDSEFDFSTPMKDMTIGSGMAVPTTRTSTSGKVKPTNWDEFSEYTILDFSDEPHVLLGRGVFEGLTEESTMQEYLESVGVEFVDGVANSMDTTHGFTGVGGWSGNYQAIANNLIGQNATEVTSLVDWSNPLYSGAINEDNFFGIDVMAGATKTVQDSVDTVSGATVRVSRESTSYQRALVEAGIISEEDVVKGRF